MDPTILHARCQVFQGKRYWPNGHGYYSKQGSLLHRRVWEATHGRIPPKHHIHHRNGNRADNRLENLALIPAGQHLRNHMTEAKRAASRARMLAHHPALLAKAAAWHRSPAGKAWHRAQGPATSRAFHARPWQDKACQQCGRTFQTQTFHHRFCSQNCKMAARRSRKADHETRTCAWCGGSFTANRYFPTKCCSRSHAVKLWRSHKSRMNRRRSSTTST